MTEGNIAKFEQNDELREFLLCTGDAILVEASPYDRIWGIGAAMLVGLLGLGIGVALLSHKNSELRAGKSELDAARSIGASDILSKLLGSESTGVTEYQLALAKSHHDIGKLRRQTEDLHGAIATYSEGIRILRLGEKAQSKWPRL